MHQLNFVARRSNALDEFQKQFPCIATMALIGNFLSINLSHFLYLACSYRLYCFIQVSLFRPLAARSYVTCVLKAGYKLGEFVYVANSLCCSLFQFVSKFADTISVAVIVVVRSSKNTMFLS